MKAKIYHDKYRRKLVLKYADRRIALKKIIYNKSLPLKERMLAQRALSKFPRNSSPTRIINRCVITGRARGVKRLFRLAKHPLREYARKGYITNFVKSSW